MDVVISRPYWCSVINHINGTSQLRREKATGKKGPATAEVPLAYILSERISSPLVAVRWQCVSTVATGCSLSHCSLAVQLNPEEHYGGVKGLGLLGIGPQLVLTLDIESLEVSERVCVCVCVCARVRVCGAVMP